ncbi:protein MAINTENANCE OF MERISTEMS-like [Lotus japonicus]|nr:protein MAINTENANCE OF MERISTEMS-like [Lotus japonicus]
MARTKQTKRVSSEELADRRAYLHASHRRGDHDTDVSTSRKRARKGAPKATTEVPAPATEVPATQVPDTEVPAPATEVPATQVPATEVPALSTPEVTATEVSPQSTPEVTAHDTVEPSTSSLDIDAVEESESESGSESGSESEIEGEDVEVEDPNMPPLQRDPPFPGGPVELSLLQHYPDHIAPWTWHTLLGTTDPRYSERGDLRLATAGTKLGLMTCEGDNYREVRLIVERSGLYPLVRCSYVETDPGLISALVERWHEETSSFHMPFGEMTVTLDDVSALLHIPVGGRFYTPGVASRYDVAETCALLLGGDADLYMAEFDKLRGPTMRFSFLRDLYPKAVAEGRYEHAARMYLMHLVGATLFADKSGGHSFSARWIGMLQDLERVSEFAWGAMALATLYDQLGQSSRSGVKQMGGYTSLLMAWVFEHFPDRLVRRYANPAYTEDQPRARRWTESRSGHARLDERRVLLDELTADDVT